MKRERIVIFILVGIMVFSVIATGLLILAQGSSDTNPNSQSQTADASSQASQEVCKTSPEVATQAGHPEGDWPVVITEPVNDLQVTDVRLGTGKEAKLGDCITVHYRLELVDGTPVAGNDTFATGSPISFELTPNGLIQGWVQGIPGLKEGGLRRLVIPPELAYGNNEVSGIPANSTLVFDVELVKIENSQ